MRIEAFQCRGRLNSTRSQLAFVVVRTSVILLWLIGCGPNVPAELQELGVKVGGDLFEKRVLLDLADVANSTDCMIVRDVLWLHGDEPSQQVALLTDCDVIVYDLASDSVISQVPVGVDCNPLDLLYAENGGSWNVFCELWASGGFGLFDHLGEAVWGNPEETPLRLSDLRDLDGDGILDVCARFEAALACFDLANGTERWRHTSEQYIEEFAVDVTIVEDGTAFVRTPICTTPPVTLGCARGDGRWEIRDEQGHLVQQLPLGYCDEATDDFCPLVRWRYQNGDIQLVQATPLRILTYDNRVLTEPETPPDEWDWRVRDVAAVVRPTGDVRVGVIWQMGPSYVWSWDRLLLTIHDESGTIIYKEVFTANPIVLWGSHGQGSGLQPQRFILTSLDPEYVGGNVYIYDYRGVRLDEESQP